jgi:hypothetical protein
VRYFVSYAAHREGGGGFFGNVIVNTRMMERWSDAVIADAQRLAPGQHLRVVILSYQPLGAIRATDVIGYWLANKMRQIIRALLSPHRRKDLARHDVAEQEKPMQNSRKKGKQTDNILSVVG